MKSVVVLSVRVLCMLFTFKAKSFSFHDPSLGLRTRPRHPREKERGEERCEARKDEFKNTCCCCCCCCRRRSRWRKVIRSFRASLRRVCLCADFLQRCMSVLYGDLCEYLRFQSKDRCRGIRSVDDDDQYARFERPLVTLCTLYFLALC